MSSFSKKLHCALAVAVVASLASPRIVWAHGGGSSGSHMSMSHSSSSMGSSSMSHVQSFHPTKVFKQSASKMSTLKTASSLKTREHAEEHVDHEQVFVLENE